MTHFQCTNGSVCAGDRVECNCTTSSGAIDWTISYRVLGSSNQDWIPVTTENFNAVTNGSTIEYYGYNFTDNPENNSRLTFYLNASESIFIVCQNGNKGDGANVIITHAGKHVLKVKALCSLFNVLYINQSMLGYYADNGLVIVNQLL